MDRKQQGRPVSVTTSSFPLLVRCFFVLTFLFKFKKKNVVRALKLRGVFNYCDERGCSIEAQTSITEEKRVTRSLLVQGSAAPGSVLLAVAVRPAPL